MIPSFRKRLPIDPKLGPFTYIAASLFVLLCGMVISLAAWRAADESTAKDLNRVFTSKITDTQSAISMRLRSYEEILRGGVGLFKASDKVERNEWQRYISLFDVHQRYPGVQGFGFIQRVPGSELEQHIAEMHNQGYPDYSIIPAGTRDNYTAIVYLEPETTRNQRGIGYDLSTEPNRRAAMERARDSGDITLSAKITPLIKDINESADTVAFSMFAPLYRNDAPTNTPEERRQALLGWVYAPFRVKEFLVGILGKTQDSAFGFELYDGSVKPEYLMYRTDNFASLGKQKGITTRTTAITNHNQTWIMVARGSNNMITLYERRRPTGILVFGLGTSLALAGFVYLIMLSRAKALALAKQQEVQRAKDELLSLASHQLRTPATGVKQYIGMLREGYIGKLTKQQKVMLDKAYESNERQLKIINQLLYVAKLDAGQILLNLEPLDLREIVDNVVGAHAGVIKDRNQTIRVSGPRRRYAHPADRQYLYMVVDNLVSNASKYSPSGGKIKVDINDTDDTVHITVSDNGVGIEKHELVKLFKKFSRLDNSPGGTVDGSGIGLYLSQHIAHLHGGEISVESEPGKGSTFTLRLPKTDKPRGAEAAG